MDAPIEAGSPGRLTDSGCRRRLWKYSSVELQILPDSDRSHCEACKAGKRHSQAACPQKGDDREREGIPGETKKATKIRVPNACGSDRQGHDRRPKQVGRGGGEEPSQEKSLNKGEALLVSNGDIRPEQGSTLLPRDAQLQGSKPLTEVSTPRRPSEPIRASSKIKSDRAGRTCTCM